MSIPGTRPLPNERASFYLWKPTMSAPRVDAIVHLSASYRHYQTLSALAQRTSWSRIRPLFAKCRASMHTKDAAVRTFLSTVSAINTRRAAREKARQVEPRLCGFTLGWFHSIPLQDAREVSLICVIFTLIIII